MPSIDQLVDLANIGVGLVFGLVILYWKRETDEANRRQMADLTQQYGTLLEKAVTAITETTAALEALREAAELSARLEQLERTSRKPKKKGGDA
jgi:hypothetical protein